MPRAHNTTRIRVPTGVGAVLDALDSAMHKRFGRTCKRQFYTALLAEFLQDAPARYWHHGNSSDVHIIEIDRTIAEEIKAVVDVPLACFGFNAVEAFLAQPLLRYAVYARLGRAMREPPKNFGAFVKSHFRKHGFDLSATV